MFATRLPQSTYTGAYPSKTNINRCGNRVSQSIYPDTYPSMTKINDLVPGYSRVYTPPSTPWISSSGGYHFGPCTSSDSVALSATAAAGASETEVGTVFFRYFGPYVDSLMG